MIRAMQWTTFEWPEIELSEEKSVIACNARKCAMKEKLRNKVIDKR